MGNTTGADIARQREAFSANHRESLPAAFKEAKFKSVQKLIRTQYPSIFDVPEALLVCDNRLPDCPVIYANDQFERMTLYAKERVVGRNCRFLQGPLTSREVVHEIGEAVRESRGADCELLNYRSDGVPFWNLFLMMPVFSPHTDGTADFFIAIQKDISLLKGLTKDPADWTPAEVCMWLDSKNLTFAVSLFLEEQLCGIDLLELTDQDLQLLGLRDTDRTRVLSAVSTLVGHAVDTSVVPARHLVADLQVMHAAKEDLFDWPDLVGWETGLAGSRIAVKCQRDGFSPQVLLVNPPAILPDLMDDLADQLGRNFRRMQFLDDDGDLYALENDDDLQTALIIAHNFTLILTLSSPDLSACEGLTERLEEMEAPALHLDAYGSVSAMNEKAEAICGDVVNAHISAMAPELASDWRAPASINITLGGAGGGHSAEALVSQCRANCANVLLVHRERS